MKIGFIGLGNMAGTICQGLIKSYGGYISNDFRGNTLFSFKQ